MMAFLNKKQQAPAPNLNTTPRAWVAKALVPFQNQLSQLTRPGETASLAVITDTHYKAGFSATLYGVNGLQHTKEFVADVASQPGVDAYAHLGDLIDGSEAPDMSRQHLQDIVAAMDQNLGKPFYIAKGNHDDNDKFDEHQVARRASFQQTTFADIVFRADYRQPQLQRFSQRHGVAWLDVGPVRFLFINTSDIPYRLNRFGIKQYDVKLNLAVREAQLAEIIQILQMSDDRAIIVCGHGNLLKANHQNGLHYNGPTVHELFRAFNLHAQGHIDNHAKNPDFQITLPFDFTHIRNARITAYVCGHRHIEQTFLDHDIRYLLLNCAAISGRGHQLTTGYNARWDRQYGQPSEYAGYTLVADPANRQLSVLGYGAATPLRQFAMWFPEA
ncbi:metallophosphoesterase family protein [Schleiferilactobacillus harbinensis]|jgi:predicted phosphodiesterase|uniref:metallophosphoesterase family protein n=1 Tax=Schleiferilactobacillus harbinensis TaxID=304207 RepID=UPI00243273C2|nr:metallophosphoesterase [Schleiferilactobacillus harbinensis]MCI1688746.1 metallophosphoesterase [Schleiferilactobacillus harbinensis]MCI1850976.1 metallophosphoesterase [Schleiferilactobacillus harbinensis]